MSRKKVLLVEDDGDDQQFFLDFLNERADLILLPPVENGEELLRYLDGLRTSVLPDCIILDQNMPKCNGLQTLKILKENQRYAHIPVMIYSTFADETLLQKSTSAGALLLTSKPSTAEGYNHMMDEFLKAIC